MRLSGQGWREKAEEERGGNGWGRQRRVGTRRFIPSHNFQILNFHVKIHPNRIIGPDLLWKITHSPINPSYSGLQGKGTLSSRSKGRFLRGTGRELGAGKNGKVYREGVGGKESFKQPALPDSYGRFAAGCRWGCRRGHRQ